ncbi:hypothetical protein [Marinobacter salarius]|uniref:hypothetical protein n=1 Tax=Marinobacter salarius TaxID=1420917 RepID=UPI003D0FE097
MDKPNTDHKSPEAMELEIARLWHELKESQGREVMLAEAGLDLVSAMNNELGNDIPNKTRRMRDRMVDALPRDLRQRLKPVPESSGDEEMGEVAKWIMIIGFPLFAGLMIWAYFVTLR